MLREARYGSKNWAAPNRRKTLSRRTLQFGYDFAG